MLDETTEKTGYWLTHKHALTLSLLAQALREEHLAINVFILYLQKSINLTNQDNVYFLAVDILIIKLLKILDQDLITKDVGFLNYF